MSIKLTKKHFDLLADVFRRARPRANGWPGLTAVDLTAEGMADELAKTNPRFDRDKFLQACAHGQYELDLTEARTTT